MCFTASEQTEESEAGSRSVLAEQQQGKKKIAKVRSSLNAKDATPKCVWVTWKHTQLTIQMSQTRPSQPSFHFSIWTFNKLFGACFNKVLRRYICFDSQNSFCVHLKQKLGHKQITVTVGLGRWSGPLYELRQLDPTEPAFGPQDCEKFPKVVSTICHSCCDELWFCSVPIAWLLRQSMSV